MAEDQKPTAEELAQNRSPTSLKKSEICKPFESRDLRLYSLPMFAIFLFYTCTTSALASFEVYNGRYFAGLELLAIAFPILYIADLVKEPGLRKKIGSGFLGQWFNSGFWSRNFGSKNLGVGVCAIAYTSLIGLAYWSTQPIHHMAERTNFLGFAGQITDRAVPPDWSVSTTELNTFGLMIPNREIIDLWGYTNPAIAHSKLCSEIDVKPEENFGWAGRVKLRNNPDFFMQTKPDVFWWFAIPRVGVDYIQRLQHRSLSKSWNQLGDMVAVLNAYDVFLLTHTLGPETTNFTNNQTRYAVTLLIRKDLQNQFIEHLNQQGYRLFDQQQLDMMHFQKQYDQQQLRQFPCG